MELIPHLVPIHPVCVSLRSLAAVSHSSKRALPLFFIVSPAFQFAHSFILSPRQAANSSTIALQPKVVGSTFPVPQGLSVHSWQLCSASVDGCLSVFVVPVNFSSFHSRTAETGSSAPRGASAGYAVIDRVDGWMFRKQPRSYPLFRHLF